MNRTSELQESARRVYTENKQKIDLDYAGKIIIVNPLDNNRLYWVFNNDHDINSFMNFHRFNKDIVFIKLIDSRK